MISREQLFLILFFTMANRLNKFLALILVFSVQVAAAQPDEADLSAIAKNSNSDFFYLLYREVVQFEIQKDKIVTTTNTNKIFCYNNYKNTNFSSFDFIYNSAFAEIKNLRASSYGLEKGKYKERKVRDFPNSSYSENNMFQDSYRQINITMPAIANGTIGQIQYDEVNSEPHFSSFFTFKQFVPIVKNEFVLEVDKNIEIAYKFLGDSSGVKFEKTNKGSKTIYKWVADDMPVIKREDYMPALNKIAPQVICWIRYADVKGAKQMVNNDLHSFSSWIFELGKKSFRGPLNEDAKQFVDSVKKVTHSQYETGKMIYECVQKNIKYIAFEDGLHGYIPRMPADVYRKRYGDCKDKATLLSAMLNYAGIESRTALIGTNQIPYNFSSFPIPECANHMVTAVKQKGKWVIADATDEYASYLSVPEVLQGQEALVLVDSLNSVICKLPVLPYYKNGRIDSLDIGIKNFEVKGNGKTFFIGYLKENMNAAINSISEDKLNDFYKEILNIGNNKCSYTNVVHQQVNDTTLKISYDIVLPNYITQFEDLYYINPNIYKSGMEDYQVDVERQHPIPFKYLSFTKHYVKINLDEMKLYHMPENSSYENEKFGFSVNYMNRGKYIYITANSYENVMQLNKPDFGNYSMYFTRFRKSSLDNISLKKNNQ